MSLNNISLPPHLLAGLYQNVLVQDNATVMPVNEVIPFLGKNAKNILIVVEKEESPFLPDKELEFLTAVLSACQLDLSHVAIVNMNRLKQTDTALLIEQFAPKEILLLDVESKRLKLPAVDNYKIKQSKGLRFVAAPSLAFIEKSREEKKALWMALKELFCI